jgi:hypothetical protein
VTVVVAAVTVVAVDPTFGCGVCARVADDISDAAAIPKMNLERI